MEREISLLEHSAENIFQIRKKYNLEAPGRMEEAVQILVDWMKQHPHLIHSEFIPKSYLETGLVNCKGSIERTKDRILNTLSLKRSLPDLLSVNNFSVEQFQKTTNVIYFGLYPKLDDNLRRYAIFLIRSGPYSSEIYLHCIRYMICVMHYVLARECSDGCMMVLDYTDTKMLEAFAAINILDLKKFASIIIQGFGLRIKGVHIILGPASNGTVLDMLKAIIKSLVPEKLGHRIHFHRSRESIRHSSVLQKNRLPAEYGDTNNMTMKELHDVWMNAVCSEKHMDSLHKFEKIYLDEAYKTPDEFDDYINGSFRKLNLD